MPKDIETILDEIDSAVYGRDVRSAIHDGISICYTDVTASATRASTAANRAEQAAEDLEHDIETGNSLKNWLEIYSGTTTRAASDANTYMSYAQQYSQFASSYAQSALSSKNAAQSAQTASESARDHASAYAQSALSSKNAAQSAQTASESARDHASAYAQSALSSKNAAQSAQTASESARDHAESARDYASAYAQSAYTYSDFALQYSQSAYTYADFALKYSQSAYTYADFAFQYASNAEEAYRSVEEANIPDAIAAVQQYAEDASNSATRAEQTVVDLTEVITAANVAANYANSAAGEAREAVGTFSTYTDSFISLRQRLNDIIIPATNVATKYANDAAALANSRAGECQELYNSMVPLKEDVEDILDPDKDNGWPRIKQDILITESEAELATNNANNAAVLIRDMTVTSQAVSSSTPGSVTVEEIDDPVTETRHFRLDFKLQKGDQGSSYIIKGTAFDTLADLINSVSDPDIGDQYNVGLEPPFNVYRWTGNNWEDQGRIGISVKGISNEEIDDIVDGETILDKSNKYLGIDGLSYYNNNKIASLLSNKVNKDGNKKLSTNDFTDEYVSLINSHTSLISALNTACSNKVDKVEGKRLSTNDFSDVYKTRVDTNTNSCASLNTNKLDKNFENLNDLYSSDFNDGLFAIYKNGSVYKLSGSDLSGYVASSSTLVHTSDIADVTEVRIYLGI